MLWLACSGGDLAAPDSGEIVVVTSTTGAPADAGDYAVSIDEGEPRAIGVNGADTLTSLTPGTHVVRLAMVPGTCIVAGDNPRTVTVPAGGSVAVTFEIACPPVGVTVTTTTTGPMPDPDGYTLQVDLSPELPIGVNATAPLPGLAAGLHSVQLNGVAANCSVAGDNPRSIEVVAGTPLTVDFTVTCPLAVLRWTRMASGTGADFPDVWGTSATDVYVVGELATNDGGGVASVIQRYDGNRWVRQFRETDLRLRGVWGSSATDVFAVGFRFLQSGAVVLHYDGVRWSDATSFTSPLEDFSLNAVWGSSATDIFAVGAASDGDFSRTLIAHYDGSVWERMPAPPSTAPGLTDVWGSSARDVYAVGRDDVADPAAGVILHYDGSAWTPALQEESLVLNAVWGSSATDVYAVGFQVSADFQVTGAVRHFDGGTWSSMPLPDVGVLDEVWGSSASDVYAVGDDGLIIHYDGAGWTATHPSRQALLGIWGSSPGDVFAVGVGGTILHGTP